MPHLDHLLQQRVCTAAVAAGHSGLAGNLHGLELDPKLSSPWEKKKTWGLKCTIVGRSIDLPWQQLQRLHIKFKSNKTKINQRRIKVINRIYK
jgi:hypothetical protein